MAEMQQNILKEKRSLKNKKKDKITWKTIKNQKQLIFMSVPFLVYVIIFSYAPLWGWLMAFEKYDMSKASVLGQKWIGLDNFKTLFTAHYMHFPQVLRNTVAMSVINLTLGTLTAIIFALLLNEIKNMFLKRTVQTISYLPHFLSMIIATGIIANVLSADTTIGIINNLLMKFHLVSQPILFLGIPKAFWAIVGISSVWKELGWNTIIYLAAISSVDPALYEAAEIDGAGRFNKVWHVTLPGIKSTIIILLIMSIGNLLGASGFELQYFLGTGIVADYSQNIAVFVLQYGINKYNFGLATAAGMFQSIVSVSLLLIANFISGKLGEEKLL